MLIADCVAAIRSSFVLLCFQFKVDGKWHTWIDYDRFQDLARAYQESGGKKVFSSSDYTAQTPDWALFGASEQGFDPAETRFQRRNKGKDLSGC